MNSTAVAHPLAARPSESAAVLPAPIPTVILPREALSIAAVQLTPAREVMTQTAVALRPTLRAIPTAAILPAPTTPMIVSGAAPTPAHSPKMLLRAAPTAATRQRVPRADKSAAVDPAPLAVSPLGATRPVACAPGTVPKRRVVPPTSVILPRSVPSVLPTEDDADCPPAVARHAGWHDRSFRLLMLVLWRSGEQS